MQSLFLFDEGSLLSVTISLSSAGLKKRIQLFRVITEIMALTQLITVILNVCITGVGETLLFVIVFNGSLLSMVRH